MSTKSATISHYRILHKLGEGGMGAVFLAQDTNLHRQVALKFLSTRFASMADFKARFMREAWAAAALSHPNIITIYEVGEAQNFPYIAMEYVEGKTLWDLIQRENLSINKIIDIAIQIGEGLGEAHRHLPRIIHRDLKTPNILIDKKGRVKIADFGLAKLEGIATLTLEGAIVGTPHYMSPEQVRGERLDPRSDIFSFGVVLYELLTRRLPFQGKNNFEVFAAIQSHAAAPLAGGKAGWSEGLQMIVGKALQKNRETRYQNVEALVADLKREKKALARPPAALGVWSRSPAVAKPAQLADTPLVAPPQAHGERRPLWIAAAMIFISILATLALSWRRDHQQADRELKTTKFYGQCRNEGDSLFILSRYAEAQPRYQAALAHRPEDVYASNQIKICDQRIVAEEAAAEAQRLYAQHIEHGDSLFNSGEYAAAKVRYQQALSHQPRDRYLAQQIQTCEKELAANMVLKK